MSEKEMVNFMGVKLVRAFPMVRSEYSKLRGWTVPADENGADEGYLVAYLNGGRANTTEYEGYVSWSPKDVFEQAYRPTNGMTFGFAIEAMKAGKRVARAGWNGKDMWVSYGQGHPGLEAVKFWNEHTREFAEKNGGTAAVLPYLILKTADNKILMGWLASQTDMLAEDWVIIE